MIPLLLLIAGLAALAAVNRLRPAPEKAPLPFLDREPAASLLLLALSLTFQGLHWYFHRDLNYAGLSVQGVPFSDAMAWHDLASSLSEGHGFQGPFSGRRPLYPLFLACFYTWLGPSFSLAKVLNILVSAGSVVLIYLVGKRVFNRLTALGSALAVLIAPSYVKSSLLIMTEALAVFFLVLSLHLLLLGIEKRRLGTVFWAGLFFALSNLTQSVTLLSFFALCPAILFLAATRSPDWKRALGAVACFALGVSLALAPWVVRQRAVHGVLAISDNMAENLYAATVPELGNWSGSLDRVAAEKGMTDARSKSSFYWKEAIRNIRENPGFYTRNVTSSFWDYLTVFDAKTAGTSYALALLLFLLMLSASRGITGSRRAALFSCIPCALYLLHLLIPSERGFLMAAAGMLLGAFSPLHRNSILLSCCLLFSGIGIALVGGVILQRASLLAGWIFVSFYFFAYFLLFRFSLSIFGYAEVLGDKPVAPATPLSSSGQEVPRFRIIRRCGVGAVLAFFLASAIRLIFLTQPTATAAQAFPFREIPVEEKRRVMAAILHHLPGVFTREEFSDEQAFFENVPYVQEGRNHRKLVIRIGAMTPYLYAFSGGEKIRHWSRLFEDRPYARTVVYAENVGFFLFPGTIPESLRGRQLLFVGRESVDTRIVYEGRVLTEGIALIPLLDGTARPDMTRTFLISSGQHRAVLEALKPKNLQ